MDYLNNLHEDWCLEQRKKYEPSDSCLCGIEANSCKDCKSIFLAVGEYISNKKVRAL